MLAPPALPRGVAYLALSAPAPGGEWLIRGAMSESDLSSWIVAGSFASKPGSTHRYDLGLSYSTQDYQGGNPAALAAVTDGSRNVGELYAFDQWSPQLSSTLNYGARTRTTTTCRRVVSLSPRFGIGVEALPNTTIRATVAQRGRAPGAEEFLATNSPGPWLPPERTFAPLRDPLRSMPSARSGLDRSAEVERQFADSFAIAVGRFHEQVDDQLVTVSGCGCPAGRDRSGTTSPTPVRSKPTAGWVRWSSPANRRVQGSVQ